MRRQYFVMISGIAAGIFGIPILGFFVLSMVAHWNDRIVVTVQNHSASNLIDVQIFTRTGSIPIGSIQKEQKYEYILRYAGPKSSLGIRFATLEGSKIEKDCDVYMESGFKGYLTVNVDDNSGVSCDSDINIGFP